MSFAALQTRLNTTAMNRLGDLATVNGVEVQARFDNAYALGGAGAIGMASSAPCLLLLTTSVPANPVGLDAVCDGVTYNIAAHEPDGAGMSRLVLETP